MNRVRRFSPWPLIHVRIIFYENVVVSLNPVQVRPLDALIYCELFHLAFNPAGCIIEH